MVMEMRELPRADVHIKLERYIHVAAILFHSSSPLWLRNTSCHLASRFVPEMVVVQERTTAGLGATVCANCGLGEPKEASRLHGL